MEEQNNNQQNQQGTGAGSETQNNQQNQQGINYNPPVIDYEKIQHMLNGTLAAKEDTALKAYFKQQGLSQQEAEQAMAEFKQQKAANQPNIQAIQNQAEQAKKEAIQAKIEKDALLLSGELGIDLKTMPYVLKMADTSNVVGDEGNVDLEKLKEALNMVLEDVPQLKPKQETNQSGFRQIGVGQQNQQQNNSQQTQQNTVPTKRWNRWN